MSAWGIQAGIAVLLIGAFGFFLCRSAGIVAINPLLGEITLPEQRGRFTSGIFRNFNIVSLLGLLVISFVMKKYASRETFQIIISCGVFAGFISAFAASKVPETSFLKKSAGIPILNSLREAAKNKTVRKLILANIAVMSGIVLVLPVSVSAVKIGYQVSDSTALMCALIQFGGGILVAAVSGVISTHSGPRPVILLTFSLLVISALMWIVAPSKFSFAYAAFIFLLNGAAGMGAPMALTHYFLNAVSARDRLGYSLFISMTAGTCAGIFSFVVGSGLLKLIPTLDYRGMEVFKIYFGIVIFLLFAFMAVIMSLERLKDWKVSQVLGLAFAPRDIRALLLLNKMEKTGSESQELDAIERLKHTRSPISADKILSYLESPKYLVKTKAMLALYEIPFGDNVKRRLLEELKYGTYTTAPAAAMILGARGIKAAVPLLRRKLDSENIYLVGRSMVALTQLEDKDSFLRIKKIFIESDNQFLLISGAVALSLMGDPESLKLLLEKTRKDNLDRSVRAEIYSSIAE
ncbi:MAG: MFS transporter [Victivallaceae bacterium]